MGAETVFGFLEIGVEFALQGLLGHFTEFLAIALANQVLDDVGGVFFIGVPTPPLVSPAGFEVHHAVLAGIDGKVAGGNLSIFGHEICAHLAQGLAGVGGRRSGSTDGMAADFLRYRADIQRGHGSSAKRIGWARAWWMLEEPRSLGLPPVGYHRARRKALSSGQGSGRLRQPIPFHRPARRQ